MDSRFASVVPDNDPRYPGMIVATIRELRDLVNKEIEAVKIESRKTLELVQFVDADEKLRNCHFEWNLLFDEDSICSKRKGS